ncbi:MAG: VanZ family protein [Paeniclostridium sordellii]|uniref:VanZ family protein n=1 Tax=Paeniclostridium hominis TaxID=2764329 RepID=A0ABR7K4D9_9FIRM|nr:MULTISPECIES: VanZ family protein [Paeniclostridium]MBC6003800.1 VanZ family protein [Paeniclostridium hominis]MDU1538963.1 VanZ family protein [Paeniclostridium sordellii]
MVIDFNLMVLVCFIAIYIFSRSLICFIKGTNLNIKNEITNLGLYMSVVFVFSATLFPIKLNVAYEGFEIYNLIPLKVPIGIFMKNSFGYFLYQTLGNIALFVPFGFFVYSKSGYNMKKTIICCFALTLFVEFIQGFIPYRFCEIDDLWLNTLGGFIGAIIYIYYLKFNDKYKKINNIN